MDSLLKKIKPKWFVLFYGLYLLDRSVMGLFDTSVASMLLSSNYQQQRVTAFLNPWKEGLPFHLPLSFLVLSFIHPILFAIASVEVAKRRFPFALYSAIQVIFSLSIVIAAISNLVQMVGLPQVREASYIVSREFLKNIAALVASPLLCYVSLQWWRKPVTLWREE
jgi:hypothetical protein